MVSVRALHNCCCNDIPDFRKQFTQPALSHQICISLLFFFFLHLFVLSFIFVCIFHHVETFLTITLFPIRPALYLPIRPFFFISEKMFFFPTSALFLAFCRAQAGHDLRFLAHGLAGELLQHCDDHQTGGGGKSEYSIPMAPSAAPSPRI